MAGVGIWPECALEDIESSSYQASGLAVVRIHPGLCLCFNFVHGDQPTPPYSPFLTSPAQPSHSSPLTHLSHRARLFYLYPPPTTGKRADELVERSKNECAPSSKDTEGDALALVARNLLSARKRAGLVRTRRSGLMALSHARTNGLTGAGRSWRRHAGTSSPASTKVATPPLVCAQPPERLVQ